MIRDIKKTKFSIYFLTTIKKLKQLYFMCLIIMSQKRFKVAYQFEQNGVSGFEKALLKNVQPERFF